MSWQKYNETFFTGALQFRCGIRLIIIIIIIILIIILIHWRPCGTPVITITIMNHNGTAMRLGSTCVAVLPNICHAHSAVPRCNVAEYFFSVEVET